MEQKGKQSFILWFEQLGIEDVPLVGGKNASLGEMYRELAPLGVNVPNGFAVTVRAYRYFIEKSGLAKQIRQALRGLNTRNIKDLQKRGRAAREIILKAQFPEDLKKEIVLAYKKIGRKASVAVRSSATAEDLPGASFAGQQETYLNVVGEQALLKAVQKVMASLFTDRAISYRVHRGFSHFNVALSVGVQEMVRSDKGASGVMFTLDTETGFDKVVMINASYGLGEMVVQGKVTPDEFVVFKPVLEQKGKDLVRSRSGGVRGTKGILGKYLGAKKQKMVYAANGVKKAQVPERDRRKFSVTDKEVLQLARLGMVIEKHFSKKRKRLQPMDIEWAKDGLSGRISIVQARPETVHASHQSKLGTGRATEERGAYQEYRLKEKRIPLLKGMAVGTKIATGKVRVIEDAKDIGTFKEGEVLAAEMTDPDWEPVIKMAAAIITDKGGRTSHAAIVSRELGIPAVVGTGAATRKLKSRQMVTVDCSSGDEGTVYPGALKFRVLKHRLDKVPETRTAIMVNIGAPDEAFKNAYLPVRGVGLGRLEFIINSYVKVHPNALIDYKKLKPDMRGRVDALTKGYPDKKAYYADKLAEGIAKIAAAFWPYEVIIRFSDFKTNEYRQLVGGELYEPQEQNPMLGWRGASRYYDERFKEAFGLECKAVKRAREEMGLTNVIPMVPFCRTPEEGRKVVALMEQYGLSRKKDPKLRVYVMCEIPSNVVRADEFLDIFDGMSIGSNDLTQLALGLDRDSSIGSTIGNEEDPTVKEMMGQVIEACQKRKKYIGVCGQAPSDFPEFTKFLVEKGIESISLNPDAVLRTILRVKKIEDALQKNHGRS